MSVSDLKSIVGGIAAGAAQQYFAAYPMVGANFLLPGRFTFGVVCVLGLLAVTLSGLIVGSAAKARALLSVSGGVVISLAATAIMFAIALIPAKAYFVFGLFVSLPITVVFGTLAVRRVQAAGGMRQFVSGALRLAVAVMSGLLLVYFIGKLVVSADDASRFIRLQLYLGGIAFGVNMLGLLFLARSDTWLRRTD